MRCLAKPIPRKPKLIDFSQKQGVEKPSVETKRPEVIPSSVYDEKELKRLRNFLGGM